MNAAFEFETVAAQMVIGRGDARRTDARNRPKKCVHRGVDRAGTVPPPTALGNGEIGHQPVRARFRALGEARDHAVEFAGRKTIEAEMCHDRVERLRWRAPEWQS